MDRFFRCHPLASENRGSLRELALSVAVHARDAQYLAPAHLEADAVQAVMLARLMIVHGVEGDDGGLRLGDLGVLRGGQLPADHEIGQLLPRGLAPVQGADRLAGAQDGDPVGDVQHFPHLVADEDDALALLRQLVHDLEQAFHLDVRQRGGGLVQHQQLRAAVQGLQDLHALLGAYGDLGDLLVELHIEAVPLGKLQYLLLPGVPVDEDALGLPVAQDDVLEHGHGLHQHEVLMDHADAQLHRRGRRVDMHRLAVKIDLSRGGLIQPEEDIHKGALAGAVLPQEGVDLALEHAQIDILVGIELTELFGDMLHAQDLFHRLPPFRVCRIETHSPRRGAGKQKRTSHESTLPVRTK